MSIVRIEHNKNNPFVMINKRGLEDEKLSWAAKGLWAYLLSRPDDWTIMVPQLSKIYDGRGGGEKAIYAILDELISEGYCLRTQNKKDDGTFDKTEYVIQEFKKVLPNPSLRDAVKPDAVKDTITNIESKEKEKQQQAAAVFFPSLSSFNAPESEKIWVSKTYAESEVIKALEELTRIEVKTTPIQTLKWLLAEKPIIPPSKKDLIEQNMELAKPMQGKETGGVRIDVNLDEVQFVFTTCQRSPESIRFEEVNFKERVRHYLKKYGFV